MQANTQNPFWMFQISAFPFQNSVIEAIKYLRYFAKNVIEERVLALRNGEKTPNDILQHIVKEAQENSEIEMDDLVDNFFTIFTAGMKTKLNVPLCCLFVFLNIHIIIELILNIRSLRSRENTLSFYITLIRYLHLSDNVPCFPSKFYLTFVFNFSWVL